MKKKLCKKCMTRKHLSEFSINRKNVDGLYTYCKDCAKKNNKEYGKIYRASKHGKEVRKKCDKAYSQTAAGKMSRYKATLRFRDTHPDRYYCHKQVGTALRNGSLVRPNACSVCSKNKPLEAHHNDYTQPLQIEWLCKECHRKKDSIIKTLQNNGKTA